MKNNKNNTFDFGLPFYENNSTIEEEVSVKVVLTTFLCIFMVLSVIGNTCTCVVILKNKNMRSPTNYYLFNLAISDLVFSIFIPIEIYVIWVPEIPLIGSNGLLIHFLIFDALSNSSVLTILALTIERYLAISRPFSCHTFASRAFKIISIIWALSGSFTFFNTYFVFKFQRKDHVYWFTSLSNEFQKYFVGVGVTVFFALPMTVIFVLFVLIVLHLRSSASVLRTNHLHNIQNKRKAIKMLAAVATSFFICWSPFSALHVMLLIKNFSYEENKCIWRVCIYLCCINSYMSTAINPILYNLMSSKFRQAFKNLFGVRATEVK